MEFSKHNVLGKLKDSENYFLINFLSRQADILDSQTAEGIISGNYSQSDELVEKGYLVDPDEEMKRYRKEYLSFIENREEEEKQLFYVPSYACNFNCPYCYQSEYPDHSSKSQEEVIDAFFRYIDQEFDGKEKYITIFGGEPLLPGEGTRRNITLMLERAKQRGIGIAVVTNGYTLKEYIPLLSEGIIREIQVTLDGTAEVHDKRRPLKGGQGTFQRIVEGVDAALEADLPVNLRMVIDKTNIQELPKLARFAIDRGWTKNPLFKTQLGRNYELHYCQENANRLYDRVGMYEAVYEEVQKSPEILEFHRPAFSISRFLFDTGEMPEPLFDSCPGTKTEWAFDYSGDVFSCTATVGKPGESLGTFYPEITKKTDEIENWEDRDVLSIAKCSECSVRLACGGGCASVAKNAHDGEVLSPDCRPIKPLLEMGLSLYFKEDLVGE
jgi:uncharacterized protein